MSSTDVNHGGLVKKHTFKHFFSNGKVGCVMVDLAGQVPEFKADVIGFCGDEMKREYVRWLGYVTNFVVMEASPEQVEHMAQKGNSVGNSLLDDELLEE